MARLDALALGRAAVVLGAGRQRQEDTVDPAVGFVLRAQVGQRLAQGEPWLEIHWNDPDRCQAALRELESALELAATPPPPRPLVVQVVA